MPEFEYIDLDEVTRRVQTVPKSAWYQFSRLDRIPGQTRIGRRVLVHWPTLQAALASGGLESCRTEAAVEA